MTLEFVTNYLDKKINENANYIVCTFYDLRVKNGVLEKDVDNFLKYAKIRLENMNYQVYFTGAKFTYNNEIRQVQDNEYMIAIKEGKKYGYKC